MPTSTKCHVLGCTSSYKKTKHDKTIRYHRLPKDEALRKLWIQFCQRGDSWNPQNAYICSQHFQGEDFMRDLKAELLGLPPKRHIKPTAIPSLHLTSAVLDHEQESSNSNCNENELGNDMVFTESHLEAINTDNINVAVQTDLCTDAYEELLIRNKNLEALIEHYKDIVQEYQIKNELLEDSIRKTAMLKNQNELVPEEKGNSEFLFQPENDILSVDQTDVPIEKTKKLLWNEKDKHDNCRLKYLCEGCCIISS